MHFKTFSLNFKGMICKLYHPGLSLIPQNKSSNNQHHTDTLGVTSRAIPYTPGGNGCICVV